MIALAVRLHLYSTRSLRYFAVQRALTVAFYSRNAMLARVLATALYCLSVSRCSIETDERIELVFDM